MGWFTPEQISELSGSAIRVALLCELQFQSETIYLWNGDTYLETNGHLWAPLRGQGIVDGIQTVASGKMENITLQIPGADLTMSALALSESHEASGRNGILYLQFFDDDWQPILSPKIVFVGWMQTPRIVRTAVSGLSGANQTITLELTNAFFNRSRPPYGRFTDADQQRRHPGDKFFSFVSSNSIISITYPDF